MHDYVLSPRAIADLAHIWDTTQEDRGEAQADHYTDALDARCAWLAASPYFGKARDEVRAGLRSYPEGEHHVFYRFTDGDDIEIVGFPHKRQELHRFFKG